MITNLSRSFHFERDQNNYNVDYIFRNEAAAGSISMQLDVSVNDEKKLTRKINKPTATLYQSNEAIEKMIVDEIISFAN